MTKSHYHKKETKTIYLYKQKGGTAYKISKRNSGVFDSIEIIRNKKELESLKSLLQKEDWQIQKGNSLFRISKFRGYKSYSYYALYDNLQQKRSSVHLYWALEQKLENNEVFKNKRKTRPNDVQKPQGKEEV